MSLEADRAERRKRAAHARDYLDKYLKTERREMWQALCSETTRLLKLLEGGVPGDPEVVPPVNFLYVVKDLLRIWER